jgi:hypothetical protein
MRHLELVRPVSLKVANRFIAQFHSHHKPVIGHKWSLGYFDSLGELHGVVIVGRPVARKLDNGKALEVTRCCVKSRGGAFASLLYNAAKEKAFKDGYTRLVTYTLAQEPAKSLQWAKWHKAAPVAGGGSWSRAGRTRTGPDLGKKVRWEASR